MIGKAKIVAKPNDRGSGGCGSHQSVNSEVARKVRAPAIAILSDLIRTARWVDAKRLEIDANRYVVLYLATLIVLIPIDLLFLGLVAKGFFTSEVGDMLGEIRPAPAILFYLLYGAGILIFVSGSAAVTPLSTLLYGALFGFFCYMTFELTSLSLFKHWTWPVVLVDVSWGMFVTAVSSTAGLVIADWLTPGA
jgi:uncharacterized membrane protein